MRDFKKLEVWEKAHKIVKSVYTATKTFPSQEIYGLTNQLRRSASSIPANIAEGCGCNGDREFARFLEIALRSASETEYHLLLSRDLEYLNLEIYTALNTQTIEIKRMLTRFIQKLSAES